VDPAHVARGGSGGPRGGPWLARETPAGCPRQASPPGDRLVRGSPGGVWTRDIPLCRPAVPGHRHGGTPAPCVFKPRGRWWVLGRHGTTGPIAPGVVKLVRGVWGRWGSNPAPGCFAVQGRGGERTVTCDSYSPTVTAGARQGPAVPDAVRTSADRGVLLQLLQLGRPSHDNVRVCRVLDGNQGRE
jgi:hypothetical protein